MIDMTKVQTTFSKPLSSDATPTFAKRMANWAWRGAFFGFVFTWTSLFEAPESNLSETDYSVFEGMLSMTIIFGLPAGIILGIMDSRGGMKSGWMAIMKVPFTLFAGSILLVGPFVMPTIIRGMARLGSERLMGGTGNEILRIVLGMLVGGCFGLILMVILTIRESDRTIPKDDEL